MKPTPDVTSSVCNSMLNVFAGSRITYAPRYRLSFYYPSCHMMDYTVHNINKSLVDHFHFKRSYPNYHPYILRLYFGVLFWIQCLRTGEEVGALNLDHHQFLLNFLDFHPLESLPIPGPLLPLFKTICSSQPEFSNYGKVYPRVPTVPGPTKRRNFLREEQHAHFLPNVPGIFALLEHLNGLINGENPVYPKMRKHIPVTENAVVFGHHSFPALADRSDHENWCLVSPGLQYYCEADQKLNESFAEGYADML
ncbi:IAA-leucine resistant 2 [Lotus japonicus]|uniref:IAA-leucine resistant 2 n=1 Tax=Lotus japonicus TaxID=34305 RepID=UPI00258FE9D2|nr:IAA-leucine resistant 2 [Lotus japonicus]